VTVTFIQSGNPRDLRLAVGDDGAKDQGTGLTSDPILPFSVDIEGHSRPFGSAWDIGADEYVTGLFGYRRQITISDATTPASCTSDLSNFPVLVKVTDADLMSASNGGHVESPNGYDIIFRAMDGTTKLDHEIEKYDGATGEVIAWVRIPTLVYNADTTIYMYYGNAGVAVPTANPAGVWGTSYKGVWHLKESGNGTGSEYDDSTQYANEGQGGRGNPLYVPTQVAGQIGYGQNFSNSDGKWDLVDVGNNNSVLDIPGNQITLEAWVRHDVDPLNLNPPGHLDYGILNHKGWQYGYRLLMRADTYGCDTPLCLHFNLGEQGTFLGTATVLTAGPWHHVVGTYDGSLVRVFIDGVQDSHTWSKTAAITAPGPPEDHVWIGHGDQPTDVAWSSEWEGEIDEVRISNVARSACWIQTQYNNQSTTDVNLGGEQPVDTTYDYHQALTIANAMTPGSCTSNLANFPVLIDTTTWAAADKNALKTVASGGHVQSTNGYDIIFRDTSGLQLDHEIESYSGSTGTLVAWVRIPSLNPSGDTIIYMYYGNSAISSPTANPMGVWNSSYKGVWHLKEATGVQVADSTATPNNGTPSGSPVQQAGQINGSLVFNPASSQYVNVVNSTDLQLATNMAISAWVNTTNSDAQARLITAKWMSSQTPEAQNYWLGKLDASLIGVYVDATQGVTTNLSLINNGTWHQVVGVADAANNLLRIYVDGTQRNSAAYSGTSQTGNSDLQIGRSPDQPLQLWSGGLDEIRISNTAHDACWIETEYNNQSSPGTVVTTGGEQVDPSTYDYNQPITITNAMTPGSCTTNIANFPVLVDTTNWAAAYKDPLKTAPTGHVQNANGYDIIFRDTSDLQLDHEIEKYDGATGTLIAWVRVPILAYNADTTIYMYYGNSLVTTPTARPTGVWNSGYKGVWHLSETSGTHYDSTGNNNDSTSVTVTTQGSAAGKIDGADFFDGSPTNTDYITVANTGSSLDVGQAFTLEAWIKRDGTGVDGLLTKAYSDQYSFKLAIDGSDRLEMYVNTGSGYNSVADGTLNDTAWHYVGGYSDGSNLKVFFDGAVLGGAGATPASIPYDSGGGYIGAGRWSSNPTDYFDGIIDEVRISNVARDACWIGTGYNNQSTPDTFVTPGGEGTEPAVYTSQRAITIRDVMTPASCGANLSSFPILIDTTNWADKDDLKAAPAGSVQSASGYDIIFRDANDLKLDHEIEKYDGATGTLVAWVRIPVLAHNANTTITMYYGNAAITSPTANPTGVWTNGYSEVWHLHETSGNHVDSTSNGYLGTVSGSITRGAAGQINGADQLVGPSTTTYVDLADGDFGNNQSFTVAAWFKVGTLTQWAGIVTKGREIHHDWVGLWETDTYRLSLGWDVVTTGYGNLTVASWLRVSGTTESGRSIGHSEGSI
jgi:hypothetical protein